MTARALLAFALLASLTGAGCGRREAQPTPAPTPLPTVSPAAGGAAEAVRSVVMQSVTVGRSINPDGSVSASATSFNPGDPIFVSFNSASLSPGTEVRLEWKGPAGQSQGLEQFVVPQGAGTINFKAKDTSGWAPGQHRIEVVVGGAPVGSKTFTIGSASQASAPAPAPR
jgi:hypothetical protein